MQSKVKQCMVHTRFEACASPWLGRVPVDDGRLSFPGRGLPLLSSFVMVCLGILPSVHRVIDVHVHADTLLNARISALRTQMCWVVGHMRRVMYT